MASFSRAQQSNDENTLKKERALFPSLKLVGGGKVVKAKKNSLEEFTTRSVSY